MKVFNLFELAQNTGRIADEFFAGRCQHHTLRRAIKNFDAKRSLEVFDGAAEIGLRNEQSA